MANDTLKFIVTVDDQGTAVIKSFSGNLADVEKTVGGLDQAFEDLWKQISIGTLITNSITEAARIFVQTLGECVTAYFEAEEASKKFEFAMRSVIGATEDEISALDEYALAMQSLTGIDDDAAKTLMQLAAQYGVSKDQIEYATSAAIALNEALGIDQQQAMRLVSQALEGNYEAFTRVLPQIRGVTDEAEKGERIYKVFGDSIAMLGDKVETSSTKWKILKAEVDNAKEAVGGFIVDSVQGWAGIIKYWTHSNKALQEEAEKEERLLAQQQRKLAIQNELAKKKAEEITAQKKFEEDFRKSMEEWAEHGRKVAEREQAEIEKAAKERQKYLADIKKGMGDFLDKSQTDLRADVFKTWEGSASRLKPTLIDIKDIFKDISVEIDVTEETANNAWQTMIEENKQFALQTSSELLSLLPGIGETFQGMGFNLDYFYKKTRDASGGTQKLTIDWKNADAIFNLGSNAVRALGLNLGEMEGPLSKVASGIAGLASSDLPSKIAGAFSLIGGAIEGITKLFSGDGPGEALDRLKARIGDLYTLTKQEEEELRKLAEDVGGIENAWASSLGKRISGITRFSTEMTTPWAKEIENIIANMQYTGMSETDGITAIGEGFDALIEKARKLGTEGARGIIDLITHVKGLGLEVPSINKYIEEQKELALNGYRDLKNIFSQDVFEGLTKDKSRLMSDATEIRESILEMQKAWDADKDPNKKDLSQNKEWQNLWGKWDENQGQWADLQKKIQDTKELQEVFGGISVGVFDEILETEKKVSKNQSLIDAISRTKDVLYGLSSTSKLTSDQFLMFEKTAKGSFDALMGRGFSAKEALLQLSPLLSKLKFLSGEYDIGLDSDTARLIKEAQDSGIDLSVFKSQEELAKESYDLLAKQYEQGERHMRLLDNISKGIDVLAYPEEITDDSLKNVMIPITSGGQSYVAQSPLVQSTTGSNTVRHYTFNLPIASNSKPSLDEVTDMIIFAVETNYRSVNDIIERKAV
jgi:hypothetical protein